MSMGRSRGTTTQCQPGERAAEVRGRVRRGVCKASPAGPARPQARHVRAPERGSDGRAAGGGPGHAEPRARRGPATILRRHRWKTSDGFTAWKEI